MDRRFVITKIKELKDNRVEALNNNLRRGIKKAKDKGKLHRRIESRIRETRSFTKKLCKYFNETHDFKSLSKT